MKYLIAIDQGTTSSRTILVNAKTFEFVASVQKEHKQIFPQPGFVEHDLNEIWANIESCLLEMIDKNNIQKDQIVGIGITNQRETTCAFDLDGNPLSNAIVWQDRRTNDFCNELKAKNLSPFIKEHSGLPIDSYFSATKMRWLLKNNSKVQEAASNKTLRFGTIDTFLLAKLTGNLSFATDASNASRTLLMNIKTGAWDADLLRTFDIEEWMLPLIKDSFGNFGITKNINGLLDGTPITGILGDQQSALFGQAGITKGDMKCTYGTGAFLLLNIGNDIKFSQNGLLTTALYQNKGHITYALEGSTYICGAAVQWLRDNLKIIKSASEIEAIAKQITDLSQMENIIFMPFFTGLGSPYWNSDAKAAILGLTRDSGSAHIARATLEGMCLSINDLVETFRNDTGLPIKQLKVDGGAVVNDFLMTIQSTVSNVDVIRPKVIETTAYGAALASAVGLNLISFEDLASHWKEDKIFTKNIQESEYFDKKRNLWASYIKKLF